MDILVEIFNEPETEKQILVWKKEVFKARKNFSIIERDERYDHCLDFASSSYSI